MHTDLCQHLHQSSPRNWAMFLEPHGRTAGRGQACPAIADHAASEEPGTAGTSEPQRRAAQQDSERTAL